MKNRKDYVLVTGGGSGIGFGVVKLLLLEGYNVIVLDKDISKLKALNFSSRLICKKIDLSKYSEVNSFIMDLNTNKTISALINNVGIQEDVDILDITINQWKKLFSVNLDSAFILSREISKRMISNQIKGSIINITSIHSNIIRGIAHYSSSKAALDMLTKEFAYKLAQYGIRVNSIAPGAVDTPMIRRDLKDEELLLSAASQVPLNRLGTPDDIAHLVRFLLSKHAKYITGSSIVIDGGLSLVI